jgi:hypothetical protein
MADRKTGNAPLTRPLDDTWEVEAGVVRPYLLTGGRTRTGSRHLAVEAMVAATAAGSDKATSLSPELRGIVELCVQPQSVAEVAARLSTPLGVVRVLVSDLTDDRLLQVHEGRADLAADVDLLERLIARVRAIPA